MILAENTQQHQLMFSDQSLGYPMNASSMNRNPRSLLCVFAGVIDFHIKVCNNQNIKQKFSTFPVSRTVELPVGFMGDRYLPIRQIFIVQKCLRI
jgi:hypothetical protein